MDPEVLKAATELIVGTTDWEGRPHCECRGHGTSFVGISGECDGNSNRGNQEKILRDGGEVSVDVSTGYSSSTIFINDIFPGERIVIVDDVISTGGTLEPLLQEARRHGSHFTRCRYCHRKGRWSREAKSGSDLIGL